MSHREVTVGGTVNSAGGASNDRQPVVDDAPADASENADAPRPGAPNASMDASHLRPLSQGVLKSLGWHKGVREDGGVKDSRAEQHGTFDLDAFKLTSDEPHVRFQRLQQQFGGVITRDDEGSGTEPIVLKLTFGDGDATTARGRTTVEALDRLIAKMGGKNHVE